jgi:transcriptional regulator of arginine metabolism
MNFLLYGWGTTDYSIAAMPTTPTERRRRAIREILSTHPVSNQAELHAILEARRLGASQPVLSRDLRALRVAKRAGVYQISEEERVTPLGALAGFLRSTAPAQRFVLVRCEPGAASAVARALEAEKFPGVVGTVAGDDTLLVAVSSDAAGARVRRRFDALL